MSRIGGWGGAGWAQGGWDDGLRTELRKTSAETLHSLAMSKGVQGKVGGAGGSVGVGGGLLLGCMRKSAPPNLYTSSVYTAATTAGIFTDASPQPWLAPSAPGAKEVAGSIPSRPGKCLRGGSMLDWLAAAASAAPTAGRVVLENGWRG